MSRVYVEGPVLRCGHCRFIATLHGSWAWRDGRLVFTAAADANPGRDPDLTFCGECGARFDGIEHAWDDAQTAALRRPG